VSRASIPLHAFSGLALEVRGGEEGGDDSWRARWRRQMPDVAFICLLTARQRRDEVPGGGGVEALVRELASKAAEALAPLTSDSSRSPGAPEERYAPGESAWGKGRGGDVTAVIASSPAVIVHWEHVTGQGRLLAAGVRACSFRERLGSAGAVNAFMPALWQLPREPRALSFPPPYSASPPPDGLPFNLSSGLPSFPPWIAKIAAALTLIPPSSPSGRTVVAGTLGSNGAQPATPPTSARQPEAAATRRLDLAPSALPHQDSGTLSFLNAAALLHFRSEEKQHHVTTCARL